MVLHYNTKITRTLWVFPMVKKIIAYQLSTCLQHLMLKGHVMVFKELLKCSVSHASLQMNQILNINEMSRLMSRKYILEKYWKSDYGTYCLIHLRQEVWAISKDLWLKSYPSFHASWWCYGSEADFCRWSRHDHRTIIWVWHRFSTYQYWIICSMYLQFWHDWNWGMNKWICSGLCDNRQKNIQLVPQERQPIESSI